MTEENQEINQSVYDLCRIDGVLYQVHYDKEGKRTLKEWSPDEVPDASAENVEEGFGKDDTQPHTWKAPNTQAISPKGLTLAQHKDRSLLVDACLEAELDALLIKCGSPRMRDLEPGTEAVIDLRGNTLARDILCSWLHAMGPKYAKVQVKV